MDFFDFLSSASSAWALLSAYPLRWALIVVVFLVAVESLTFIPYAGFVIKLAVAGVVVPHVIALFSQAAAGQPPSPVRLLEAFAYPPSTLAVFVGASLLPFAVGIAFLYVKGGRQAIEFFFGNMLRTKPPPKALFERFKYVTQVVALPFTFLAGAAVIKGLSGLAALSAALSAAVLNWLPILLLALLALAFEWSSAHLPSVLPKPAAVLVGIVLIVAYLAWSFAITYTISDKVFGTPSASNAA